MPNRQMPWHVYIIRCRDSKLYTGITNNLQRRIKAHNSGNGGRFTSCRAPVELLYSEEVLNRPEALKREAAIKRLPRIKKLELTMRVFLLALFLFSGAVGAAFAETGTAALERIVYKTKPLGGRAEYTDLGPVDLEGRKVNKSIFHTLVLGFADKETIYSLQENLLPVRVERDIRGWIGREHIVEVYDQNNFTVTITKYKGKNKISERVYKAEGPIHNAVLMMFYVRRASVLNLGWRKVFYLPDKFEITLSSVEKIKIFGKSYMAYHFTSQPDKFEIWINKDEPHIPLLLEGRGGLNYKLTLKEYHPAIVK